MRRRNNYRAFLATTAQWAFTCSCFGGVAIFLARTV